MKISTLITTILIAGGFFFVFAMMSNESATLYPDANINSSAIDGKYNYVNDINNTISPLQESFKKMEDPETGWFTKIVYGIAAVPYAIVKVPGIVFSMFGYSGSLVFGIMDSLGLPTFIILLVGVMIVVWGIIKLIEIFQRWDI